LQARRPDDGTWHEAWTVREAKTRGFDREGSYHRLSDTDPRSVLAHDCAELTDIAAAAARGLSEAPV